MVEVRNQASGVLDVSARPMRKLPSVDASEGPFSPSNVLLACLGYACNYPAAGRAFPAHNVISDSTLPVHLAVRFLSAPIAGPLECLQHEGCTSFDILA